MQPSMRHWTNVSHDLQHPLGSRHTTRSSNYCIQKIMTNLQQWELLKSLPIAQNKLISNILHCANGQSETTFALKVYTHPLPQPTSRRHVADTCQYRQILADIACCCNTEERHECPIYINYSRQVQISLKVLFCEELPTCNDMLAKADIIVSFWTPCRQDILLCLRHDQRRVATCRRHNTECRRLGNKNDTPTSDIVG